VLAAFEETGRCRRGYFVEGLGAAQFGTAGAIDRLRTHTREDDRPEKQSALALAATDPANPFGAALPWPPQESGHRPGRKAGAIVALVDGSLTLYVERGGKTLLTFTDDEELLALGIEALGRVVRQGALGRLTVEKADGASILGQDSDVIRRAMESAGFIATPRGLRLRGGG
jgi:ATP-dependent Lhr-like helicase